MELIFACFALIVGILLFLYLKNLRSKGYGAVKDLKLAYDAYYYASILWIIVISIILIVMCIDRIQPERESKPNLTTPTKLP